MFYNRASSDMENERLSDAIGELENALVTVFLSIHGLAKAGRIYLSNKNLLLLHRL